MTDGVVVDVPGSEPDHGVAADRSDALAGATDVPDPRRVWRHCDVCRFRWLHDGELDSVVHEYGHGLPISGAAGEKADATMV